MIFCNDDEIQQHVLMDFCRAQEVWDEIKVLILQVRIQAITKLATSKHHLNYTTFPVILLYYCYMVYVSHFSHLYAGSI